MLLCAQGLYPANQSEPRAAKPYPTSFAHSLASARFANAPPTAQATIVLPAFVRSCSADGGIYIVQLICHAERSEVSAAQQAYRRRSFVPQDDKLFRL